MIKFARACPNPISDLSHAKSSECFATILPLFTKPFLMANFQKSSGVLPVLAWMLSMYALNVIMEDIHQKTDINDLANSDSAASSEFFQSEINFVTTENLTAPRNEEAFS